MRSAQVTIKDIASRLGISPSTVSRALKDHPDISPETKEAVQKLAKELNYNPNLVALSLRHSKTNTIGVIIPEMVHYFFSTVISGIEDLAYDSGYNVMICQSNELYEREVSSTQALLASRIEGLLVSLSKTTIKYDHFINLYENGIPIVFFDRFCPVMQTDRVIVDDFTGAYNATKHLIKQGCQRIAHLFAPQHLAIGKNRLEGYLSALKDNNIQSDNEIIVKCDTHEEALEIVPRLLNLPFPPDGIFAVNDNAASAAMICAKNKNLKIPDDIAIVGFSNSLISTVTDPGLTSVEQSGYEMGRKAMEMLLNRINSEEDYPAKTEILKTDLIIRKSSKKIIF
ncbi:MAG: LacI family DNA-binding transcriptional regulator [Bacteroidales bacterium]|nr:LacI family DNA-binding transcriptional regulator [Bacteroidales bacterium]